MSVPLPASDDLHAPCGEVSDERAHLGAAVDRYVRDLESIFIDLRGRGVLWTRDDVGRAAAWHAAGIPLATVRRVIAQALRAWRATRGEDAAMPVSLRSVEEPLVRAVGGRFGVGRVAGATAKAIGAGLAGDPPAACRPRAGEGGRDAAEDGELAWLTSLAHEATSAAAGSDDPAVRHATLRAGQRLQRAALLGAAQEGALDASAAVAEARQALRKAILKGIGATAAAAVRDEAAAAVPPGCDAEIAARQQTHGIERLLSARYGALWPTALGWRPLGAGDLRGAAAASAGSGAPRPARGGDQ